MKKKFRFQIENGYIYEGSFEIIVRNHIAEIEESDINRAILFVIEANGGQEMIDESARKVSKGGGWGEKKAAKETVDILEKVRNMGGGQ